MKYKTYPKMKDSGLNWIGDIPNSWDVSKLKRCCLKIVDGVHSTPKYVETGIPFISVNNFTNGKLDFTKTKFISEDAHHELIKRCKPEKGDLLLSKVGTLGQVDIIENKFEFSIFVQLALLKIIKEKVNSIFLKYFLKSNFIQDHILTLSNQTTLKYIGTGDIGLLPILIPSLEEQKTIGKFLDWETSKIDSEVTKNNNLLDSLIIKKQAIINQVVTRGIDQSVEMVDSKIERIGKIPQHWKINKIKFTSYVKGRIGWEGLRSEEFTDDGAYLITGTDFDKGEINWSLCHHVELWRYEQNPFIQIKENDILITKDGTIGKIAFVVNIPEKTTLNSGVMVIRPLKKKYTPSYLFWLLKSNQFIDFIDMIKSGSTIQHLYQETFENFKFTLPPTLDEQKNISEYLDKKIKQMDDNIYLLSRKIKKLRELRYTLISSAVTGKICVTN